MAATATQRLRRLFVRSALVAAACTALLALLFARTGAYTWLEAGTYDARSRFAARTRTADPRIVILDVDNPSFDNLKDALGRWPWSRAIWTETVRYLKGGHPRAIAFDVIFEGPESNEVDSDFTGQIQQAGNVLLAYAFNQAEADPDAPEVVQRRQLIARAAAPVTANTIGEPYDPQKYALSVPLNQLGSVAAGLGSVNASLDDDGITRRVILANRYGDETLPSLAARAASMGAGQPEWVSFTRDGHDAVAGNIRVPVDADGRLLLAWPRGGSDAYERIPFSNLVCSIYPSKCGADVKRYPRDYFRDKIVIVGASAIGAYEVRPTPFDAHAPGFIAHATAIDNLLHNQGVRLAPRWLLPVVVIVFSFLAAWLLIRITAASRAFALVIVLAGAYTAIAFFALSRASLWVPLVGPLVALGVSFAATSGLRYATTGRELRRTRGTLDRYMAPQLVEYVLDHLGEIQFAGEKRELTILFSDVRNFTTLTEGTDPLELIALLNEYLHEMTECIFKYHGVVDKFIGDGILAYWGAFTPGKNHALLAAQSALEMFERLRALNARWAEQGRQNIDIGVGINTGEVIFGNVGAGKKIEFTVIGDPVNLAARLESLNKQYHAHIIISDFTLAKLGDKANVKALGGVTVKGKTVESTIFELIGLSEDGAAVPDKTELHQSQKA